MPNYFNRGIKYDNHHYDDNDNEHEYDNNVRIYHNHHSHHFNHNNSSRRRIRWRLWWRVRRQCPVILRVGLTDRGYLLWSAGD